MKRHLLIVLRTCTTVDMVNDTGSGRYIKVPKHQLVNTCVSSLIDSINQVQGHEVELVVLDDHSTSEAVQDIKNIISHCKFPTSFISVEGGTGNGYSMAQVYQQVEARCQDLWYHVEDDYLHYPEAIHDMIDTIDEFESKTGQYIAINPHDDVWRYKYEIYPSYILHGPYRHYRTVKHTTYTCMASRAIYDRYRNHFQDVVTMTINREDYVENKSINLVWQKEDVSLFSPIPGLAFHIMDPSGKDPYIDVDELWNSVPKLWRDSSRPKMAIVSLFNERHADLAAHTWYNNKVKYADKHGYLAIPKTDNFSTEQVHFDKFVHLLDVMKSNPDVDWVWWLDNDAMITNFDIRVEDLVDLEYHVIMPTDIAALNTGSFIVRNSAEVKEWLEFLLSKKAEYKNDKKWFEQQAVIDFYPKFQHLFKIIPQQWLNSYDYKMYNVEGVDLLGQDGQWYPGDFVIHWPGLPNEARIQLAQQYQQFVKDTR
jgi:glycosyltransferase involved in cell wall biosynthesis